MVAAAKRKSKTAKFPSKEFFVENQGDAFAIMLMLLVGCQYFSATREATRMFVWVAHRVNASASGSERALYNSGVKDLGTLVSATLLWLVVLCSLEEYVCDKYLAKLRLSKTRTSECRLAIFDIPYALGCLLYQTHAILDSLPANAKSWMASRHLFMSSHQKVCFLLSFAYLCAMVVKAAVSKSYTKSRNKLLVTWTVQFLFLYLVYQFRYFNYGSTLILLHGILMIFRVSSVLTDAVPLLKFANKTVLKLLRAAGILCSLLEVVVSLPLVVINVRSLMSKKEPTVQVVPCLFLPLVILAFGLFKLLRAVGGAVTLRRPQQGVSGPSGQGAPATAGQEASSPSGQEDRPPKPKLPAPHQEVPTKSGSPSLKTNRGTRQRTT